MLKVLHLCLGLYDFWTTYEGEYINESLMSIPHVDLKIWGKDRILYNKKMRVQDIIDYLYDGQYPDVVIVHAAMERMSDTNIQNIFKDMHLFRRNSFIIWKTADCFGNRMKFYLDQIKRYKPQLVLNWYPDQVEYMQDQIGSKSQVRLFLHAVGRRYFNKNYTRPYDLALIGRCENRDVTVTAQMFNKIKVYTPPNRKSRADKGNSLITDLNLAKFSWNSPVKNKNAGLRFVEAPACGTVSMVPNHFIELDMYFPPQCYVTCDYSLKKCQEIIRKMSLDKYLHIQQEAYKIVMNNHTMDNRIGYLLDLIDGKDVDIKEYYGITW